MTAWPASQLRVFRALNGVTFCGGIAINVSGQIITLNATGGTLTTSTTVMPLNQWVRIEGFVTGSATAGQIQVKIFLSPDAGTPTETNTTVATLNTNGAINTVSFGDPASATSYTFWMSNLGACDTSYVGPVVLGLSNNFEESSSGTTITTGNSGGAGNNNFDSVFIGTGYTVTYDNAHAAHGTQSMNVTAGSTASEGGVYWVGSAGTQPTIYFRCYIYLTANPSGGAMDPVGVYSGATAAGIIGISRFGHIQLSDSSFSVKLIFTGVVPLSQWFRVEGYVTGDPVNGIINAVQYNSMDSVTPTESHTVTGVNTVGLLTAGIFGQDNSIASVGTIWLDDVGLSNTGYLGPVAFSDPPVFTGAGPANTIAQIFPGAQVPAICPVAGTGAPLFLGTATTAAPTLSTSGDNENAVMQVQPGMLVRAVVLVDTSGNFVS
jgi:hypothetical protein